MDRSSLVSTKVPGQYNRFNVSGSGIFPPNSAVNFQVSHLATGSNDTVKLIISGSQVTNPISQTLYN
jgi:hypothetical protein